MESPGSGLLLREFDLVTASPLLPFLQDPKHPPNSTQEQYQKSTSTPPSAPNTQYPDAESPNRGARSTKITSNPEDSIGPIT
ncbi:hypothetical protein ASPWEDRAFT_171010 [Aspergillus wentii DTO 134E9]|uniref:Uncharacterized protein n=1 Tax=Aspergillus wentii DTO 134E9 TaxID=1073089 RepID=A0A1L9RRP7_ASPWE|nr:uncharacterized protein ASPWEDRAFT_171010 [Aspergillus wentii DTO 134E9]KAI9930385.1 hypothetical protein MW887_011138 [Aspergillus wentii]OJJ37543.1 hypothetical protein ASPWEDRAFT_171010 [Aspergillus wentii DTO 134E9]